MHPQSHEIFKHYPITQIAQISTGDVPEPYHIYSGYGAFIGGIANIDSVRNLLKNEQVVPVQTMGGEALVGIWVLDFTEASLGPHHELQISVFVGREGVTDLSAKPLGLLEAMLTRKDVQMLCHGLWNNARRVVAYNRELLSLNARLMQSRIERQGDLLKFEFLDQENRLPILRGELAKFGKISLRANIQMIKLMGLVQMFQLVQQPWVSMQVVNPVGVRLSHNATAQAHTKNDRNVVNFFDENENILSIDDPGYRALGFQPLFVQYMEGFKFVYLAPSQE